MLNLDEIKSIEQAATPGEWYFIVNDSGGLSIFTTINGVTYKIGECYSGADAESITHSRTDILALIEQYEQDEKLIATLKKALELMHGFMKAAANVSSDCYTPEYFIQQAEKQLSRDALEDKS